VFGLLAGCATSPVLVRRLSSHSVTDQETQRIVLTGSEGGYGASLKVSITEEFLIQDIWDRIYQSRPYKVWYASGYRQLDFYRQGQDEPSLTLLVNASDACHIKDTTERFRCPGISAVLEKLLKHEYKKNVKSEQGAAADAKRPRR
jgi:hypothetical protein